MSEKNISGLIILDKPAGISSQTAVNKVRRAFNTKRVGHTGTLDPMATGVLPVLVGSAVKASELLVSDEKCYEATLKLGLTTDTLDTTGEILSRFEGQLPTYEDLLSVLPDFTGDIMQTPPMYSALKVSGKKLCDLARSGVEVERQNRPVTVFSLDAKETETAGEFLLSVHCSKGTYIRTLCDDIGKALGCGGVMAALRRTASGDFSLDASVDVDTLLSSDEPEKYLIPTDKLFEKLPEVRLPEFYSKLARCGNEIYLKKLGLSFEEGARVRVYDSTGDFFAVSECTSFEGGLALKSVKMFV